jgi:hypothetical protein
LRFE